MHIQPSVRLSRFINALAAAGLITGALGCANTPSATDPSDSRGVNHHFGFVGAWTTQLPQGRLILFYPRQSGSGITGTVTNFGPPVEGLTFPISGSMSGTDIALEFLYPAGLSEGPTADLPVTWTFHGAFTSATTVEGFITSSSGINGTIIITEDTGPLPLSLSN